MIDALCIASSMVPLVALISASWLYTWLHTNLPVHVFEILRWLGWRKHDATFWAEDWTHYTRADWEMWINTIFVLRAFNGSKLSYKVAEWLTCRRCLSWHFTGWTTLLIYLLTGEALKFAPITWWTAPWLTLYLVRSLEKHESD